MRSLLFFIAALALCAQMATAQIARTTLEGVEVIDSNTLFKVMGVDFLGISENESPARLYYSFFHPDGAFAKEEKGKVEVATKPLVGAIGSVEVLENGAPGAGQFQWLGSSTEKILALYARKLADGEEQAALLLASEGQFFSKEAVAGIKTKKSPAFEYIPWEKRAPEAPKPTYVDSYRTTSVTLGMSGKISYLTLSNHTVKPEGQRGKLLSADYKAKHSIYKKGLDEAFETPNMAFHSSLKTSTPVPQANDPVTGHTSIMGAVSYKKDKTKENSHLREFALLTFDNEGGLVKRAKYDSDVNLAMDDVYPIKGKNLAPEVDEVTKAVFVAKGLGNNGQLRRIFVVDIKTGELVKTADFELLHPKAQLLRKRYLVDGRVELAYLYTEAGKQGLSFVTLGEAGLENFLSFDNDSPELTGMGLPEQGFIDPRLVPSYTFETQEGGLFTIERLHTWVKTQDGLTREKVHGYALCQYGPDGLLKLFAGLASAKYTDIEVVWMDEKSALAFIHLDVPDLGVKTLRQLLKINLQTGKAELLNAPKGVGLLGAQKSTYVDTDRGVYYLAGQAAKGKGLIIFPVAL